MMSKTQDAPETVDDLLKQGLELYGQNQVGEAVECWRRVLSMAPNHPEARDYLQCAGIEDPGAMAQVIELGPLRDSTPPPTSGNESWPTPPLTDPKTAEDRERPLKSSSPRRRFIENLMHNGRYEEALAVLYKARASNPSDPKLSKSIRLMRQRLALHYTSQLSNLDLVPVFETDEDKKKAAHSLPMDERQVLGLVDGISSFGDIVASCTLGRLATLRVLARLREEGLLSIFDEEPPESQALSSGPLARASSLPTSGAAPVGSPGAERSTPTPPSPQEQGRDSYTELFSAATTAYLLRDLERAKRLFGQCLERRPDDRRVQHNLNALERKLNQ